MSASDKTPWSMFSLIQRDAPTSHYWRIYYRPPPLKETLITIYKLIRWPQNVISPMINQADWGLLPFSREPIHSHWRPLSTVDVCFIWNIAATFTAQEQNGRKLNVGVGIETRKKYQNQLATSAKSVKRTTCFVPGEILFCAWWRAKVRLSSLHTARLAGSMLNRWKKRTKIQSVGCWFRGGK